MSKKKKKKKVVGGKLVNRLIEKKNLKNLDLHKTLELASHYLQTGNLLQAKKLYRQVLKKDPHNIIALYSLSIISQQTGEINKGIELLLKAIAIKPDFVDGYNFLGVLYDTSGDLESASQCYQKVINIVPGYHEAYNNLGSIFYKKKKLDEAITNFRKALSLKPDYAIAHNNLGNTLKECGLIEESIASYNNAIYYHPNYAEAYNGLGDLYYYTGKLSKAEASFRKALSVKPDYTEAHSNLLFTMNVNQRHSPDECLLEAQHFGSLLNLRGKPYKNWTYLKPNTSKHLRVGFVSGDFRQHPVGYFIESMLANLNSNRIEFIAYNTQPVEDNLTSRIKTSFRSWRSLVGVEDAEAAQCIHNDGINILIDLAGHTAKNRLPVFAFKPAPVQVTWLGYFATTGLEQMDYLLADIVGVPIDKQNEFTEQIWYIPDTRLCFTPPDIDVPISPLPAINRKHITFGCFQNMSKLNDEVLKLWSRILNAQPNSVLRIQNKALGYEEERNRFKQILESNEISTEQVNFYGEVSRSDYLKTYAEIDMLLDTFPFPGGTTTCEALWMGVPTLTLQGNSLLERQGASLLRAAGLSEWVATNHDEYMTKALAFSRNLEELAQLRKELREKISKSPLFNAKRFASNFEKVLLDMWKDYLKKSST